MSEWTSGTFVSPHFALERGGTLPEARLAYVTVGRLNEQRDNVVLLTHGYTSSHRFAEPDSDAAEGSWSELVGPRRSIDTERFFVVCSNVLGSCHGSSGPASVNPDTALPYDEAFPRVTLGDTVRLQRMLLDSLGVERLHAVAGPSLGGFQALQWGVQYPESMKRLVVAVAALKAPTGMGSRDDLVAQIRAQSDWNNGSPQPGAIRRWLIGLRVRTLTDYGMGDYLAHSGLAKPQAQAMLENLAARWAESFHPWSLVSLRDAFDSFDVESRLGEVRAPVLLALSTTDRLFPASQATEMVAKMETAGVRVRYQEIASRYGHLASGLDWALWDASLREFLN